jgi:hypothetical protein
MDKYSEYIQTTYKEIREAVRAYDKLSPCTPDEVKKAIWKALVEAHNLVQNEMLNLGIEVPA